MKELGPFLGAGLAVLVAVAVAVTAFVVLRLRLARVADALGGDVRWCRVRGTRGGREFSYCTGGQHQRPALSLLELPVEHELVVLPRDGRLRWQRHGLEHAVAGIEPAFDRAVAVFSDDQEFARALFARPEARRAVTTLLEGSRDKLVLQRRRASLMLGRPCWAGRSPERLTAGLDRLVELYPHLIAAARVAPAARDTLRRRVRRVAPVAAPIVAALIVAAAAIVPALMKHWG
ncbi:MAG TPA: hypothetical protein VFY71_18300 [Planctomycetota bacterium]|nr:hypothetical protein [Planctomycetota bacterium]